MMVLRASAMALPPSLFLREASIVVMLWERGRRSPLPPPPERPGSGEEEEEKPFVSVPQEEF